MKSYKLLAFVSFIFVFCSSFTLSPDVLKKENKVKAENKEQKNKNLNKTVYAFGFSASFKDSVAYYTPIHVIESVELDKNKFLSGRSQYSNQLKEYVDNHGNNFVENTSVIYFNLKKKKLEKQYNKIKNLYGKNNSGVILVEIPLSDFKFTKVDVEE